MIWKSDSELFEALDSLKPHEAYICSGASPRYALWGGLMSTVDAFKKYGIM
jgi:hypothetical protein